MQKPRSTGNSYSLCTSCTSVVKSSLVCETDCEILYRTVGRSKNLGWSSDVVGIIAPLIKICQNLEGYDPPRPPDSDCCTVGGYVNTYLLSNT